MKGVKELIKGQNRFTNVELENYFDEEMKDDTFKKVVSKCKLPKDKLIKYTSLFKDCACELKNCSTCKNILECKNSVIGYVYYPDVENDNVVFSYVPCKYKKKLDKDNKYKDNIISFDMPREVMDASMKDIYTDDKNRLETIKWLTTFIKKYEVGEANKGLYLTGNFGCGKTYVVAATFNELAKKGKKVAIVYYPEFLRRLKESFSDDYKSIFDSIRKSDLLLFDDIGAETVTNWNRDEVLGTILQYRMQEKLPTFFTSNLSIKELEEHLISNDPDGKVKARRIIERIKYLSDNIEMIAENRRK